MNEGALVTLAAPIFTVEIAAQTGAKLVLDGFFLLFFLLDLDGFFLDGFFLDDDFLDGFFLDGFLDDDFFGGGLFNGKHFLHFLHFFHSACVCSAD